MAFDAPNINIQKKTNEENMQTVKGYLTDMSENLNYTVSLLEARIDALEKTVASINK